MKNAISESEYQHIKKLFAEGKTIKQVARESGRGHASVATIRTSNDLNHYRQKMRKYAKKDVEQKRLDKMETVELVDEAIRKLKKLRRDMKRTQRKFFKF